MSGAAAAAEEPDYPSRARAWLTLAIFVAACLMSYVDRQVLSLLVGPIRHDLGISDTQFSLLQGFAFSLFFVCVGLPYGWLVDRTNRRNIILFGIVIWSTMTILSGFTTNFIQLAVTRMGLGAGEAALIPATYSLLADYFPPRQHGRAVGIFFSATYGGVGFGYVVGGLIIRAFDGVARVTLPLVGALPLWKAAFICVGIPALLVAIPMAFVREVPRRGGPARSPGTPAAGAARSGIVDFVRRHAGTLACVIGAYVVAAFLWFAWSQWFPTYLIRQFGMAPGPAGLLGGSVIAVTGILGSICGGALGDRWTARGVAGGKFRLTLITWSGAVPAVLALLLFDNLAVSMVAIAVFSFTMAVASGSVGAALQDMVPSDLRGRIVVLNYSLTSLLGLTLAPLTVALVTDRVFHDDHALRYSLGLVPIPMILLGFLLSRLGMPRYDRIRIALRETPAVPPASERPAVEAPR